MADAFISAKGIKRSFVTSAGEFWALKGVDADIGRGQLTILKGRSGSGKTTLLNILGALDKPTEGRVLFEGMDITRMDEQRRTRLRRKQIGFVLRLKTLAAALKILIRR